jgi:membrane-associated protease RseP (regulator of RpoE activity)
VETWQIVGVLYGVGLALTVLFVALTAALLRLVGGRATTIDVGTPAVLSLRRAEPRIRIGPLPLGSVHILGAAEPAEVPLADGDWRRLGLARRLLVILGPWLAITGVAVALLGPARAARSFASAIDQIVFTLDPTPLVRELFALVAAAPLPVTAGIVFAKLAVLNLLPLGSLAGGQVVGALASAGRREPPKAVQIYLLVSTIFVMLYLGGRFAYAFVRALVG